MHDRTIEEKNRAVGPDVIRLKGVSRTYSRSAAPALHPTDLAVREGEFFSLLGPSGCGKTTTLRLIAGFEEADSGAVYLDGKDVTHTPPYRRNVNTVFQNYALFPNMTARENVAFPLKMAGATGSDAQARVAEALAMVNMGEYADRLPHLMSGGQRQRIALARAIVGRPRVLLLDEPLGALDLKLRQQMQHVLIALQREIGITFVYVTHDQGEALSMSDRIAVMNAGRIQQIGAPQDIYYRPTNAFVADFIGGSNILTLPVDRSGSTPAFVLGPARLPAPAGESATSRQVALRHEAVSVAPEGEAKTGPVGIPATVTDVLFLGQTVEYTLQAGEHRLTSVMPSRSGRFLARGDAVTAGFDPADIVVLDT
jgi:spermidine/putrescine transport system ATP-binding protein